MADKEKKCVISFIYRIEICFEKIFKILFFEKIFKYYFSKIFKILFLEKTLRKNKNIIFYPHNFFYFVYMTRAFGYLKAEKFNNFEIKKLMLTFLELQKIVKNNTIFFLQMIFQIFFASPRIF